MARKNKLPDSLELLLDTMCNTFGAIMFIAISLVIISQVTTKIVRDKKPMEITEEQLAQMRSQLARMSKELADKEAKMALKALAALNMDKEKKGKVEKLLKVKAENQQLLLQLSQQRIEKAKQYQKKEKAQKELDQKQTELDKIEMLITQQNKLYAQILLSNQELQKKLQGQIEAAKKEEQGLEDKKDNMPKQTLTFSMETSTEGLSQYVVCLKNGRLYRQEAGEVRPVKDTQNFGHFRFIGNGQSVSGNADASLNHLLGTVSSSYFVTIFCDQSSYNTLVALRKYLRKRSLMANFIHTEDFYFGYGNVNASY